MLTTERPLPAAIERLRRFFGDPAIRLVTVRDAESGDWIRRHLEPAATVTTSPDLVCGLTLPDVGRPADPPILGLVVRARGEPTDLTHVRRLAQRAVERGYRVRTIVLATGRTREHDRLATAELDLPTGEAVESDDLSVLSRAIGECSLLASMKFHGTVVATMYGIPSLVLVPTAKNRHFMRSIGRPDLVTGYFEPDLPDRIDPPPRSIEAGLPARLRADAIAALAELRRSILAGRGDG
jgi:polysaccharide pyruvyl transferase WcaK-like protein